MFGNFAMERNEGIDIDNQPRTCVSNGDKQPPPIHRHHSLTPPATATEHNSALELLCTLTPFDWDGLATRSRCSVMWPLLAPLASPLLVMMMPSNYYLHKSIPVCFQSVVFYNAILTYVKEEIFNVGILILPLTAYLNLPAAHSEPTQSAALDLLTTFHEVRPDDGGHPVL